MTTEPTTWQENLANKWWGVKIADHALQVGKDERRQRVTEHAIENAYHLATQPDGQALPWPRELKDEEMGVSVGDTTNHIYQQPQQPQTTVPTWAKVLGGAAVGAALVGPVSDYLEDKTEPPPAEMVDADTQYEFGFGDVR